MPYNKIVLRSELSRDEGRRNHVYRDSIRTPAVPSGYRTVGVGFNLDTNAIPDEVRAMLPSDQGDPLDPEFIWPEPAIDALLDISITAAEHVLDELLPMWHSFCDETVALGSAGDGRTRALLNLAFNMGKGHVDAAGVKHGLMSFEHFLAAVAALDWAGAAQHLRGSGWERQVGPARSERIEHMLATGSV